MIGICVFVYLCVHVFDIWCLFVAMNDECSMVEVAVSTITVWRLTNCLVERSFILVLRRVYPDLSVYCRR